jgi:CRP-like cAMP-binding protein
VPRRATHQSAERNRLLRALPAAVYARFLPLLTVVSLETGEVVAAARARIKYVYFPRTAVFTMISVMKDGAAAEVGTAGDEGIAGLPAFLGVESTTTQSLVQFAGDAGRIGVRAFRTAVAENDALHVLLLRYTHAFMSQVAQTAACNRLHPLGERCARWLLMTDDRVAEADGFFLTQEHLSYMLGVRREAVSAAASVLQSAGIIHYSRGHMTIIDRRRLEAAACECYAIVSREHERALG